MANEKRLIDANALRKRMFSYYSCVDENSSKEYYKGETLMSYEVADMIEDCIDNAPTVDAVEVVHGRWIAVPSSDMMTGKAYKCSECNKMRYGSFMPNYCQICGAKMDGGNEDG